MRLGGGGRGAQREQRADKRESKSTHRRVTHRRPRTIPAGMNKLLHARTQHTRRFACATQKKLRESQLHISSLFSDSCILSVSQVDVRALARQRSVWRLRSTCTASTRDGAAASRRRAPSLRRRRGRGRELLGGARSAESDEKQARIEHRTATPRCERCSTASTGTKAASLTTRS